MYFNTCKTAEELKKEYHKIAVKLHPDNGGSGEEFKNMQAEYSRAWDRLKNIHVNASGEQYEKETDETPEKYMDIIEKLIHMNGVFTEICGSWIWCTGNTKDHKDNLKAMGFRWSGNKKAWYFHEGRFYKKGRRLSLEEIRAKYGSDEYENAQLRLAN